MPKTDEVYIHPKAIVETENIGFGTRIWAFAHILKGAEIGCNCNIGNHCFIEGDVKIGNDVVIKNGVSVWAGVSIEDQIFIGPNVTFTNDLFPRAKVYRQEYDKTIVKEGASIGANATLISPLTIGRYAMVGAGAVVTHNIPDFGLLYGNPAHLEGFVCCCGKKLPIKINDEGLVTCSCGVSYQKEGIELKGVNSQRKLRANYRRKKRID